jgi:uncharacterized RDD family membrane protein YckC
VVSPPSEGALAPAPSTPTPPRRDKAEALRDVPALRKKESTWRDEVSERVRHRRRRRAGLPDLPLFDAGNEPAGPRREREEGEGESRSAEQARDLRGAELLEEMPADLPLVREPAAAPERGPADLGDLPLDEAPAERWREQRIEDPAPAPAIKPVERPARFLERLRAGGLDLVCLASLWAIVVYFASRAAHVPVPGLGLRWPYLAGYLAFLGLFYATYFTGTTGQTPGKMVTGLRVVDTTGQPPGYVSAFLRALLGVAGILAAGLGLLPMAFDPARRGAQDRLFGTRVVKG